MKDEHGRFARVKESTTNWLNTAIITKLKKATRDYFDTRNSMISFIEKE
jgi:hypothetical protein